MNTIVFVESIPKGEETVAYILHGKTALNYPVSPPDLLRVKRKEASLEEILSLLSLCSPTTKGLAESMKESKVLAIMVFIGVAVFSVFFAFLFNVT